MDVESIDQFVRVGPEVFGERKCAGVIFVGRSWYAGI